MKKSFLNWAIPASSALSLTLGAAACSEEPSTLRSSVAQGLGQSFNTLITESVQIDQDGAGPGDANLTVGAAGEPDFDFPVGGPATFTDWSELDPNDHRLLDLDNPVTSRDDTAFPGANECVGAANVLSKMDLTYVGVANNNEFAYLVVQRSANNGDAGYYWLFTKAEPTQVLGESPCSADQRRLTYTITEGDVLIGGHFKPSAAPLLTVYRAAAGTNVVLTAVQAIDFTNPIWQVDPTGVAGVAVNTTETPAGSWGAAGVKSASGTNLGKELIAEAAIDLAVFTGEGSNCGAIYYGSVITRASGSGGNTPDLKDLAGPAQFVFGSASATAELRPTCEQQAEYEVTSAIGADGQPIANPTCEWEFSDGSAASGCGAGVHAFGAPGNYSATVTVTDPGSNCSAEVEVAAVDVYPPLGLTADLTAACDSSFTYDSTPSGGTGSYSFAWTFSGAGTPTPAASSSQSGTVAVDVAAAEYTGMLTVTDGRTDIECTTSASDSATPYAPLHIDISPDATALSCPIGGPNGDAVTYTAAVTGGDGNYNITWSGDVACAPGMSCTVNPDDAVFCAELSLYASVADGSGLCAAADSETETYSKVTIITATDND
jgi:hypothetical protein